MPWWLEYSKSKISALSLPPSASTFAGAGILFITISNKSGTPSPVLPDTSKISSGEIFSNFDISFLIPETLARGESILLTTGIIVCPRESAIARVVRVWACTP